MPVMGELGFLTQHPWALAGVVLLAVAALAAIAGLVVGLAAPRAARGLAVLQIITPVATLGALGILGGLVFRDGEDYAYVLAHHAPAKAGWAVRAAAVWAGQAGGLLLWCVELALVALWLRPRTQARSVAVVLGIQACLLVVALISEPFKAATPGAQEIGLNAMLINPMMVIHPPMLFLGYALLAVPFAMTLGALIDGAPEAWASRVWPWLLVGGLALTAGNGFGAVWAYKTLGWGGFWGWDPVENTSFVPWVIAAAAVHALWLARQRGTWLRLAAVLAILGFVTVLYGSFLSRSGLLSGASVHAYAGAERTMFYALAALISLAVLSGAALLAYRWSAWRLGADTPQLGFRPTAWGTVVLLVIAVLVVIGMSVPIIRVAYPTPALLTSPEAVATVGDVGPRIAAKIKPEALAYNMAMLPLAVALLACLCWPVVAVVRKSGMAVFALLAGAVAIIPAAAFIHGGIVRDAQGHVAMREWAQVIWLHPQFMEVVDRLRQDALASAALVGLGGVLLVGTLAVAGVAGWQLIAGKRPWLHRAHSMAHLGVAIMLLGTLASSFGGYLFPKGGAIWDAEAGVQTLPIFVPLGQDRHVVDQRGGMHTLRLTEITRENVGKYKVTAIIDGRWATAYTAVLPGQASAPGIIKGFFSDTYFSIPMVQDDGGAPVPRLLPEPFPWTEQAPIPAGMLLDSEVRHGQLIPAGAYLEVSTKPLIGFVWLGMWLVAAGLVMATVRRVREARQAASSSAADTEDQPAAAASV